MSIASWNTSTKDVEFSAYAAGIVESGGTCVVEMVKGNLRATGRTAAVPDATTTSCGDLRVPGAAVSSGTWSATITYTSPSASGISAPSDVMVP